MFFILKLWLLVKSVFIAFAESMSKCKRIRNAATSCLRLLRLIKQKIEFLLSLNLGHCCLTFVNLLWSEVGIHSVSALLSIFSPFTSSEERHRWQSEFSMVTPASWSICIYNFQSIFVGHWSCKGNEVRRCHSLRNRSCYSAVRRLKVPSNEHMYHVKRFNKCLQVCRRDVF